MEEKVDPREAKEGSRGPSEAEIQKIDRLAEEGKLKPGEGLVPIFSPRVKAAMALALGLGGTACTGPLVAELKRLIHPPAIVEEIAAREELAPEIGVSSEDKTAPEYIRRVPVEVEEKLPVEEVSPKPEAVVSLNLNYIIRPGDTFSEIAQRFGTTQEEILTLNPEIKDIHSGEELVIPEVSVERTVEFLQDLQNKIDEICDLRQQGLGTGAPHVVEAGDTLWDIAEKRRISVGRILEFNQIENPNLIFPGQKLRMPKDAIPSRALKEIFDLVESDLVKLQTFIESGEQDSLGARKTSEEIMEYWNIAPGEKEEIKDSEIIVFPEAENGDWIAEQIKGVLRFLPNLGRVVEKVFIVPREFWPDWDKDAGVYSFRDHGAHIYIFEYRLEFGEKKEWTKDLLISCFVHESDHGASLYSEGHNLRYFTPTEVIYLVLKDTQIWNQEYQTYQGVSFFVDEEQSNAQVVSDFMRRGKNVAFRTPELRQARLRFVNLWLSKQLGKDIDVIRLGEQLGLR